MSRGALRAVAALLLVGCGAPAPTPTAPRAPFSAAEIRDASAPGRTYVQRLTPPDGPASTVTIRFAEVDARGATLEISATPDGGPAGPAQRAQLTWADFESHGVQPPAAIRSEGPCEVPAGRFDCVVFVVESEAGRQRSSFARQIPGMPVRIEREIDGRWITVAVVERHTPGG